MIFLSSGCVTSVSMLVLVKRHFEIQPHLAHFALNACEAEKISL